ncbi:MAG: hypothetical protein ACSLE3_14235 [Microbacteriaceae bacterium]
MNIALIVLIVLAPFALAAALAWAAHRGGHLRLTLDQFGSAVPFIGRLAGSDHNVDMDGMRTLHDLDAIRTRFEQQSHSPSSPSLRSPRLPWPTSSASGERR